MCKTLKATTKSKKEKKRELNQNEECEYFCVLRKRVNIYLSIVNEIGKVVECIDVLNIDLVFIKSLLEHL